MPRRRKCQCQPKLDETAEKRRLLDKLLDLQFRKLEAAGITGDGEEIARIEKRMEHAGKMLEELFTRT